MIQFTNSMFKVYYWLFILLVFVSCTSNKKNEKAKGEKAVSAENISVSINNHQLTAKQAFKLAEKELNDWDSNARLVEISTYPSTPTHEGICAGWKFEYASASKNLRLEVLVRRGEISQTDEGKLLKNTAIVGNWIDSDKVADIGTEYLNYENSKLWFGLASYGGTPAWNIRARKPEGKTKWVRINAINGELIKKW